MAWMSIKLDNLVILSDLNVNGTSQILIYYLILSFRLFVPDYLTWTNYTTKIKTPISDVTSYPRKLKLPLIIPVIPYYLHISSCHQICRSIPSWSDHPFLQLRLSHVSKTLPQLQLLQILVLQTIRLVNSFCSEAERKHNSINKVTFIWIIH